VSINKQNGDRPDAERDLEHNARRHRNGRSPFNVLPRDYESLYLSSSGPVLSEETKTIIESHRDERLTFLADYIYQEEDPEMCEGGQWGLQQMVEISTTEALRATENPVQCRKVCSRCTEGCEMEVVQRIEEDRNRVKMLICQGCSKKRRDEQREQDDLLYKRRGATMDGRSQVEVASRTENTEEAEKDEDEEGNDRKIAASEKGASIVEKAENHTDILDVEEEDRADDVAAQLSDDESFDGSSQEVISKQPITDTDPTTRRKK